MKVPQMTQDTAGQGKASAGRGQGSPSNAPSFSQIIGAQRVRFSSHAEARIERRGVKLTEDDLRRLGDAVDRMQEKGVKDALVYMNNNVAMVVSVKNRTVVTALDSASAKENTFTNIDSAAIL